MQTRLLSTCRADDIRHIACLPQDMLVTASSDTLIWYQICHSALEEVRRWSQARSFALFGLHDHGRAICHLQDGPFDYSLQVIKRDGLDGPPIPVPFYWVHQVTADSIGSLLAAFGSVSVPGQAGWIAPEQSCLIDLHEGEVQRLPYSAVAIQEDALYFVHDGTLYRIRLSSSNIRAQLADTSLPNASTEVIANDIPSTVTTIASKDRRVQLATPTGLYVASSSGVAAVHNWGSASRVLVCGDVLFVRDVGPEVDLYDVNGTAKSSVRASSNAQVTAFDAFCTSRVDNSDKGSLMIVSEKGVVDHVAWSS